MAGNSVAAGCRIGHKKIDPCLVLVCTTEYRIGQEILIRVSHWGRAEFFDRCLALVFTVGPTSCEAIVTASGAAPVLACRRLFFVFVFLKMEFGGRRRGRQQRRRAEAFFPKKCGYTFGAKSGPLFAQKVEPLFGEKVVPLFGEKVVPLFGGKVVPFFGPKMVPKKWQVFNTKN